MDISELLNSISIPTDLKDLNLPDPAEVNYWADSHNRTFYVDFDLDDQYGIMRCLELIKTINRMNFDEKDIPEDQLKPIYLYIECLGGDLAIGFNLADVIKSSRIPIYTIAMGDCMSAAFIIFISGKKRFAYKHTQLLCHQGSAVLQGNAADVESAQASYKKQLKEMDNYILENTSIDPKLYAKKKKTDWYITAQEALDYKVIDKIIENSSDVY